MAACITRPLSPVCSLPGLRGSGTVSRACAPRLPLGPRGRRWRPAKASRAGLGCGRL